MVKSIGSLQEFERETAGPGLVVVDFYTTWCGPCKKIAPIIEEFATKYPNVKFIKVDIEQNEDIANPRNIQSIPTFHFIVNGKLEYEMKGADPNGLEQKVQELQVELGPPKDPKDMSIKELMKVIRENNLASKAVGLNEKAEFVALVEEFLRSKDK